MTTKYNQVRDINGYNGYALPLADEKYSVTLGASSDTTLTIPGNQGEGGNGIYSKSTWVAVISYTDAKDVWVAVNATAAAPAGATFAATTSQLLVQDKKIAVNGADVLHFFTTASNVVVSVALYNLS